MNYTDEGDRLLHEHGYDHLTEPAFSAQWRNVTVTEHIEEVIAEAETVIAPTGPPVTMYSLMRGCTRRQREVGRLARLLQPQARRRRVALSLMIAAELGIGQRAVNAILSRMYCRMQSRYRELTSREPSPSTIALWRSEQQHKRRQVYRRPARGWVSAYRWARRRNR